MKLRLQLPSWVNHLLKLFEYTQDIEVNRWALAEDPHGRFNIGYRLRARSPGCQRGFSRLLSKIDPGAD